MDGWPAVRGLGRLPGSGGERRTLRITQPPTAVEKIVAASVVVVVIAAEIWFFFFAHYRLLG